ncbi:Cofilin-2 [Larimichthys crocea]|uniref:Cofilin-2 n=1 Tax=Larimichthys crocea TaxID=215358 RepID=A0A6G0HMJ7_LARCR|nr:cofilin-2 [Larimichthys crocea]KAE8280468.1 Cofilin-2 [Larimichthys crocea]
MASGAKCTDRVKSIYNEMKVVKNDADQNKRIRLVVFGFINNDIDVEKVYLEEDLVGQDVFKFFQTMLPPDSCRYVLYDCHYETKESSKKEELVLVVWCPETAKIKEKMSYASSKVALKKVITGVKHDLQLNDPADFESRDCFAEKLSKDILLLEGTAVNPMS